MADVRDEGQEGRQAAEGQGDLRMQLLQLQCIISAKDKEHEVLRQHIQTHAQGSDDLLQHLQQENSQLRALLLERSAETQRLQAAVLGSQVLQAAASSSGGDGGGGVDSGAGAGAHDLTHAAIGDDSSPLELQASIPEPRPAKWPLRTRYEPAPDVHGATIEAADGGAGAAGSPAGAGAAAQPAEEDSEEVLALNVSGTVVYALRSTLTLYPGSHLHSMFRHGSDCPPPRDPQGRPFLPLDAAAFSAVVEALQAQQVLGARAASIDWSARLGGAREPSFRRLVAWLGLRHAFSDAHRSGPGVRLPRTSSFQAALEGRTLAAQQQLPPTSAGGGGGDAAGRPRGGRNGGGGGAGRGGGHVPVRRSVSGSQLRSGAGGGVGEKLPEWAVGPAGLTLSPISGSGVRSSPSSEGSSVGDALANGAAGAAPASAPAASAAGAGVNGAAASAAAFAAASGVHGHAAAPRAPDPHSAAPSAAGAPAPPSLAVPPAVLAALRPLGAAPPPGLARQPPNALGASEAALRGLKVPNMYAILQQKAAADVAG